MKKILPLIGVAILTGCAYMKSNTHSVEHVTTNGVLVVEQDTHARAFTFFDANSSLTKFRNGSQQSTWSSNTIAPGTYASGLNENSSGTNATAIAIALAQAAIAIASKAP